MKKILSILLLVGVALGVFYLLNKKEPVVPPVVTDTKPIELCFGLFTPANERGFSDKYTLQMLLDGGKVTGELKFLPGEKDSKVGKFEGTVSAVDRTMMARTADVWWDTFGEGISAKEQLKFIFGEGTASLGAGELVDRGDGVYVYKDPANLHYTLDLYDVACSDFTLRDNVESYLRENISKLSPVKAVLGGTWYVIGVSVDLAKSSGTVVYEDGHIQEKRSFSYTADAKGEISSLVIQ